MTSFSIFALLSHRDNERELLAPLISHDENVLVVIAIEKHNVMLIHEPVVTAIVCLSVCLRISLSFISPVVFYFFRLCMANKGDHYQKTSL